MKKSAFILFAALFAFAGLAFAETSPIVLPSGVDLKQGMLMKWNEGDSTILNLSTFTVARTVATPSFNKWANAAWDGWSIDAGFAYDSNNFSVAAVMLGRDFGTIGKYLPIEFPLADKITFTFYPFGMVIDTRDGKTQIDGASGVGLIKFNINF